MELSKEDIDTLANEIAQHVDANAPIKAVKCIAQKLNRPTEIEILESIEDYEHKRGRLSDPIETVLSSLRNRLLLDIKNYCGYEAFVKLDTSLKRVDTLNA